MLRLRNPQQELWDDILPEEARRLSEELQLVDTILDDQRFLEPFLTRAQRRTGRPTIPMEQYLRLMYLKHRYGFGYERLVEEVRDSFSWKRFCRIPLAERVPHSTTLSKLTRRFGPEAIQELNQALVGRITESKLVRGRRMQTDTTVMESNVEHPTDADLLADGVRAIGRAIRKLGEIRDKVVEGFRDRTRTMKGCLRDIGTFLKRRTEEARDQVNAATAKAAQTARKSVEQAREVLRRARRSLGRASQEVKERGRRACDQLTEWVELTERALEQTRLRLEGILSIPDRMVSLFDPEARPICRGRRSKPVEFGYKVQLDEVEGGVVSGYQVSVGNPADVTQAVGAVERHIGQFGRAPQEVATDRGFTSTGNEKVLQEMGVERVSMPVRGKRSKKRQQHESQSWFRRLQRWRAGGEATISRLKRGFGLGRSRLLGHQGASTWVGFSIFAHNLVRAKVLVAASAGKRRDRGKGRASRDGGSDPGSSHGDSARSGPRSGPPRASVGLIGALQGLQGEVSMS